jgi:hypothetical protein
MLAVVVADVEVEGDYRFDRHKVAAIRYGIGFSWGSGERASSH